MTETALLRGEVDTVTCYIRKVLIYCYDCSDLKHEYLVIKDKKTIHRCIDCGNELNKKRENYDNRKTFNNS